MGGPLGVAGVVGFGVEGAAVQEAEGFGVGDGHGDFVAVLQVCADAWEGVEQGDGVGGEFGGGADAAEFEQLGGVEGAAAEDHFVAGVGFACSAAVGAVGGVVTAAEGAGFVEVCALEVGYAGCFWFGTGLVEENAGDEGVCFQSERMACGDGVEDTLSDLHRCRCVSN